MKSFPFALAVCSVALVVNAASSQTREPRAWEMRDEDRLERRLSSTLAPANPTRPLLPNEKTWKLSGDSTPELFFPAELLTVLMHRLNDGGAATAHFKLACATSLKRIGWNEEEFWATLTRISSPYLSMETRANDEHDRANRAGPADRRRLEADLDKLRPQLCVARADALRKSYSEFGRERFDQFLYTAIAPTLSITSTATDGSERERLKNFSGVCQ